jgi:hypothetical protein
VKDPRVLSARALWWGSETTRDFMAMLGAKRRALLSELEQADPRDPVAIAGRQGQLRLIDSILEGRDAFLSFSNHEETKL